MSDAKPKGPRNTDVLPIPQAAEAETTLPSPGEERIDLAATQPVSSEAASSEAGPVASDQAVTDRNAAPPSSTAHKPAGKVMLAGAAAAPSAVVAAPAAGAPAAPQKTQIDDGSLDAPAAGSAVTRTVPASDEHVTLPAGPPRPVVASPQVKVSPGARGGPASESGGSMGLIIGGTLMVFAVIGAGAFLYARSEKTKRDDAPTAIPVPTGSSTAATATADASGTETAPDVTATTLPTPTATTPGTGPGRTGSPTGSSTGPFTVPSWLPSSIPTVLPSTIPTFLPSSIPSTFPFPPPSGSASGSK